MKVADLLEDRYANRRLDNSLVHAVVQELEKTFQTAAHGFRAQGGNLLFGVNFDPENLPDMELAKVMVAKEVKKWVDKAWGWKKNTYDAPIHMKMANKTEAIRIAVHQS